MTKKKTTKKEKASISEDIHGFIGAPALIVFGGKTLGEAQDKVFDYVAARQTVCFQQEIRDYARQKGYTWMSGEYCPTGNYLMRFRGYDLKTFSAVGRDAQEAEAAARMVLKCMPDAKGE